jgi:hypothetical protein
MYTLQDLKTVCKENKDTETVKVGDSIAQRTDGTFFY